MSDGEEQVPEKIFIVEKAKNNRAGCKHCKQKCTTGEIRFVKLTHNPFGAGKMRNCYHIDCMLEMFLKQRPNTKRIQSPDDLDGYDDLSDEDRKMVDGKIKESESNIVQKYNLKVPPAKPQTPKIVKKDKVESETNGNDTKVTREENKDGLFREFRRLVADITNESSYLEKTKLISKQFAKGSDGVKFRGDVKLWCRLLIPRVVKRIYNLQSKQLVKLFSRIFSTGQEDMLEHLEGGDVSETIQHFFLQSKTCKTAGKSLLTLAEVDDFLEQLSQLTKEDEQVHHFKKIVSKSTANDLKVVIRLIKGDLKMNAGAKHILEAVHPDAYEAFQSSRDVDAVIDKCLAKLGSKSSIKANIALMTPVLPMLAQACRSVEQAMKKCPNGMYSEIKYDGERVQVHKNGSHFQYYSRSLKPVVPHKIQHFKDYIPEAFPHGKDLILDSEILMVDVNTGKPLPFGTLGVHKKANFKEASVCLFVFDCIYYNGEDLMTKPIKRRKEILKMVMNEIPNRIVLAEMEEIHIVEDLKAMIAKVLKLGLEGLVLKDIESVYEPGKRHWLKVKKDYLFGGAMADTADLIVLGAWYGTGKMGGLMSIFLMGCYDAKRKVFCTVTKVHNGHDDKTIERLQGELDMVKIAQDVSRVPDWLRCTKPMTPDFVARDPKAQPVWEITGAEFTKQHDFHTADGISIRFPRVTRIRDDKTWESATNLEELAHLYRESKENTDVSLLFQNNVAVDDVSPKRSPKKAKMNGDILKYLPSTSKGITGKRKVEEDDTGSDDKKVRGNGQKSRTRTRINSPIPDYFGKVNLLLKDGNSPELDECVRYFVAYGGNVLEGENSDIVTHVLHAANECPVRKMGELKSAIHVTPGWIKDSINAGTLLEESKYRVYLVPD